MADSGIRFGIDTSEAEKDIKRLEQEAEELDDLLSDPIEIEIDADGAKDQLGELTSLAKSAFSFEAIGGAGDFLSDFAEQGREARVSLQNLAAQTGASGTEIQALSDSAESLFRVGVGESVADATKAIATAKQQLGGLLDAEGMEAFTARAAALGKVFDKDVSEVIGKSRTLISQFGLGGSEAADLVSLAMQKAGTAMDDVLDTTDEYSQVVKQAGFNAEEFVGTLVAGVQAGTRDTDKLADAIKETQIRLRAGDTSTALESISSPITATIQGIVKAGEQGKLSVKDVLQQSAQAIETAFDAGQISETMRSQLQVAVSGTPAEDLGAEIYARTFGAPIPTDKIREQAKTAGEQMQQALAPVSFLDRVGKEFDLLQTKASELFAPVISGAGQVLGTVSQIGPAISLLGSKENPLGAMFSGLVGKVTSLIPAFGAVGTSAAAAGTATTASFAPVLATVLPIAAAVAAVAGVLILAYKQSDTFRASIDGLVQKAKELWDTLVAKVKPVLEAIGEVLGEVFAFLGDVASVVLDLIIAQFEVMVSVIGAVVGTLYNIGAGIADFIAQLLGAKDAGDLFGKIFAGIKSAIGFVADGVRSARLSFEVFKAAIGSLGETAGKLWDQLTSFDIGGFFGTLVNGVNDAADAAAQKIRDLKQQAAKDEGAKGNLEQLTAPLEAIVKAVSEGRFSIDQAEASIKRLQESFSTLWAGTSSTEEAMALFDEYRKKIQEARDASEKPITLPKPKGASSAVAKAVDLVGFADIVESASRAAENIRKQIQIDAIADDTERQEAAEREKLRLALQALDDRESALKAKHDEAVKKGNRVDEATYTAALAALKDQRLATEEQTQAELREIVRKGLEKQFADAMAMTERAAGDRLKILQLQQEAATQALTASLETEELAGELKGVFLSAFEAEEAVMREQLQQDLAARVANEEAFKVERARIISEGAAAVTAGTKTEAEVQQHLQDQVSTAVKARVADTSSYEYATVQAMERRLAELKRGYLKRQTDEGKKNIIERLGFEETITEASLNLQKSLYSAFFDAIDTERKADLEKQLEANAQAAEDLKEKIKSGDLDYYQSNQERVRILNERFAIEKQIAEESFDIVRSLNRAAAAGFSATQNRISEEFSKTSERYNQSLKDGKDTSDDQAALLEQSAVMFGLIVSEAAVSGENLLKASASAFLDVSLRLLEAESKAVVALIFGKSVAADPIFGALAAAGLIAAFTALAAVAKNALNIQFRHGGYTGDGGTWEPAGVVHKGEFVHTTERTEEYWEAITAIHRGTFNREWVRITDIPALATLRQYSTSYVTPSGSITQDSGLHRDIAELRVAIAELHGAAGMIPNRIDVDVKTRQQTAVEATISPRAIRRHQERQSAINFARR